MSKAYGCDFKECGTINNAESRNWVHIENVSIGQGKNRIIHDCLDFCTVDHFIEWLKANSIKTKHKTWEDLYIEEIKKRNKKA